MTSLQTTNISSNVEDGHWVIECLLGDPEKGLLFDKAPNSSLLFYGINNFK